MQIEMEQQKARETEERLQKTRAAEEKRVADLESKLSDLSETVGTYDRGRQQDQHAIQSVYILFVSLNDTVHSFSFSFHF